MPIDVSGFVQQPQQWAGLYHAADTLEKNKLRADQLAISQQAKRNAAGTFLEKYLDPKDFLSGTAYDPMILHGLQTAMQHGAALAAAGADSPSLMMALGPMVNKLTTYSTNAKNINKQIDDQIAKMKESNEIGYDYAKLKDEALRHAFYKTDPKTGLSNLDPDAADPTVNYVQRAIERNPENVTTSRGFDEFAQKAKMKTLADDTREMDKFGNEIRNKYNLKFQEYMQPVRDPKTGKVTGFEPVHDVATEAGQPLFHTTTDANGNQRREPVKLLDEHQFDTLPSGLINNIKGQVKQHLNEYESQTGEKIPMGSLKAKNIARAIAYQELNSGNRNYGSIEHAGAEKLSPQQIQLNVGSSQPWLNMLTAQSQARAQGTQNVKGKNYDVANVLGKVLSNDQEILNNTGVQRDGKQVYDITGLFPGGGLKAGRGVDFKYKGIYYDPGTKALELEKESKDEYGLPTTSTENVPYDKIPQFMYRVGPANGIPEAKIKDLLEKMGFKDGKAAFDPKAELNKRKNWVEAVKSGLTGGLNFQQQ
jgi:hypothetical protein